MRLPLPDPRDALAVIARSPQLVEVGLTLIPRAAALLDSAEQLLARVDELIDRIEDTRSRADGSIERIDATIGQAGPLVVRAAVMLGGLEPTVERGQRMFDAVSPSIDRMLPLVDRLARTTSPEEVEAVVRLVDLLPELVDRTISDILPIVENMQSVAPDIHDMLDTMHELNEMIAKIPGMGRVRQRVEEKQAEQALER